MRFSCEFLLNMLENDDSNLQTKFSVHITSNYFQNNLILKSWDYTNPYLSILKAYLLNPEGGCRFNFVLAKIRGKDELTGTWSNFTHWLHVLEHRGEKCLGGLLQLFGELG